MWPGQAARTPFVQVQPAVGVHQRLPIKEATRGLQLVVRLHHARSNNQYRTILKRRTWQRTWCNMERSHPLGAAGRIAGLPHAHCVVQAALTHENSALAQIIRTRSLLALNWKFNKP